MFISVTNNTEYGIHGYDNTYPEMHPFFIAKGPGVKSNHKVPPFSTLDLYNLFCAVLNLKPDQNNGTFANIRDIIVPFKDDTAFLYQGKKIYNSYYSRLIIFIFSIIYFFTFLMVLLYFFYGSVVAYSIGSNNLNGF